MKWLILPCVSMLLFGIGSIFLKRGLAREASEMLFPIYIVTLLFISLFHTVPKMQQGLLDKVSPPLIAYSIAMGLCVGLALICQFKAMDKYPAQGTMIILIISLFPVVTIVYDLCIGHPPTSKQWIGIMFCFVGLIFIGYPKKEAVEVKNIEASVSPLP
jgi:drug/metabolite transporter (DMT)-like permease